MTRELPILVVVSGPPGSGKTTVAHQLAAALSCPAICRDEIKEGMARAVPDYVPKPGDELDHQTLSAFFGTLRLLLEHGVSVVGEAAFQDQVWTPNLVPLGAISELRVVQCHTGPETARRRVAEHAATRTAHADAALLGELEENDAYFTNFCRLATDAPSIDVDTTDGYTPTIEQVVAFLEAR